MVPAALAPADHKATTPAYFTALRAGPHQLPHYTCNWQISVHVWYLSCFSMATVAVHWQATLQPISHFALYTYHITI